MLGGLWDLVRAGFQGSLSTFPGDSRFAEGSGTGDVHTCDLGMGRALHYDGMFLCLFLRTGDIYVLVCIQYVVPALRSQLHVFLPLARTTDRCRVDHLAPRHRVPLLFRAGQGGASLAIAHRVSVPSPC